MLTTLIVIHVFVCILLVVTVLLQFGKGAEVGAVMGSGASQAIFSSSSKGNFFTKLTSFLAIAFMVNSIILSTLKSKEAKNSLLDNEAPIAKPLNSDVPKTEAVPTTPTAEAAPTTEATPTTEKK